MTAPLPAGFRVQDSLAGLRIDDLDGFFVGWPRRPNAAQLHRILAGSSAILIAVHEPSGRVAGFVNALTDGELCAFLPLLEVRPEFQGQGLGTALVRLMRERLADFYAVDVITDPEIAGFYERLGFQRAGGLVTRQPGAIPA